MICRKHGCPMPTVPENYKRYVRAPLHRCPECTAEFRAAFAKAKGYRQRGYSTRQHVLPPVIMSERWP